MRMKGKKMASIRKEILIEADCEEVWAAARDVGALHERLASGFVVDTRMEGDDRIVTFAIRSDEAIPCSADGLVPSRSAFSVS